MLGPREDRGGLPEQRQADWDAMLNNVKAMTATLAGTVEDAQQLLAEDAALFDQENEREWNGKPVVRQGVKVRLSALSCPACLCLQLDKCQSEEALRRATTFQYR